MLNLEDYKLDCLPDTCYYIPNFITEAEEKLLLHEIYKTPLCKWTQLSHRRLMNIGGVPTSKGMIAETIPNYLQNYVDRINEINIFPPNCHANHILLNEYKAGEGIMSHFDGPMFFPTISTLSIGSHCVLEFNKPPKEDEKYEIVKELKVLVEPRSLLILKDNMYTDYMHSISEIKEDDLNDPLIKNLDKCDQLNEMKMLERTTRISLTIRHVPKTSKMKLKFFK
ncbi:alpha-ketoglutarate-dependent dioxygenase alkB homolog 6-like [Chironomus tepperi]|uniref:alpha-ketoglutarate-dependent dioxygenase alkB homolog 6-like n=1 Tax=Chironomus tepperi TaxID=113505 RepID=UPI00391FBDF5